MDAGLRIDGIPVRELDRRIDDAFLANGGKVFHPERCQHDEEVGIFECPYCAIHKGLVAAQRALRAAQMMALQITELEADAEAGAIRRRTMQRCPVCEQLELTFPSDTEH